MFDGHGFVLAAALDSAQRSTRVPPRQEGGRPGRPVGQHHEKRDARRDQQRGNELGRRHHFENGTARITAIDFDDEARSAVGEKVGQKREARETGTAPFDKQKNAKYAQCGQRFVWLGSGAG